MVRTVFILLFKISQGEMPGLADLADLRKNSIMSPDFADFGFKRMILIKIQRQNTIVKQIVHYK